MTLAMGRGHKHTWRPHPPGGRWRQSWDEVYWDEEEMANNRNTNSQDKLEDIKFFLSRDPDYRNSDDWPELVEWCSSCPETRKVKFEMEDTEVTKEEKVNFQEEGVKVEEKPKEMKVKKLETTTQTPKSEEPNVDCSREVCTQTPLAASTHSTQTDPLEEGRGRKWRKKWRRKRRIRAARPREGRGK